MQLTWRKSKAELHEALRRLPAVLSGAESDPYGLSGILLTHAGNAVLRVAAKDFDAKAKGGRGKDGLKWKPLAPVTLERRREKGYGGSEILKESEQLRRALDTPPGNDPDSVRVYGQVFRLEHGSVTVGIDENELPYVKFHQSGTEHMPARPVLPVNGQLPVGWEREVEEALEAGMVEVIEEMVRQGGVA